MSWSIFIWATFYFFASEQLRFSLYDVKSGTVIDKPQFHWKQNHEVGIFHESIFRIIIIICVHRIDAFPCQKSEMRIFENVVWLHEWMKNANLAYNNNPHDNDDTSVACWMTHTNWFSVFRIYRKPLPTNQDFNIMILRLKRSLKLSALMWLRSRLILRDGETIQLVGFFWAK